MHLCLHSFSLYVYRFQDAYVVFDDAMMFFDVL